MREIPYDRAAAVAYARKWALSRKILPFTILMKMEEIVRILLPKAFMPGRVP